MLNCPWLYVIYTCDQQVSNIIGMPVTISSYSSLFIVFQSVEAPFNKFSGYFFV